MNVVILAGGQGTRLWPMSRQERPKQFFDLLTDQSLLEDVYQRLRSQYTPEQIFFATLPEFVPLIKERIPEAVDSQFFLEAEKKDSGPAMAYACFQLQQRGQGDEPVVFVPTDHFIADDERFLQSIRAGEELIHETGKMLDIAVTPRFASTQLGYTQIGERVETRNGVEIHRFAGHTEKPDEETANAYLEKGNYLWHANYYMWTPNRMLDAFASYVPEITHVLKKIQSGENAYAQMPEVSIDYALTEKMDPENVLIIRGDFGWSDIGTWNILYDRLQQAVHDDEKNVVKADHLGIDTSHSLVYGPKGKLIATVGIHDMIIVDTKDALFICPKHKAREVKQLVALLREQGFDRYL